MTDASRQFVARVYNELARVGGSQGELDAN